MIHWITENLGTGAWEKVEKNPDLCFVDVRDLVDKSGNLPLVIKSKIDEALAHIQKGKKVVICCDYGMSRSNAIAAGVLAISQDLSLEEAVRKVVEATGETSIKIEVLSVVRNSINVATTTDKTVSTESSRRRILVTGASGFIGSLLIQELQTFFEVLAPSSQNIDLIRDTVSFDLLVKEQSIGTIVHLANPRIYTTNESMGISLTILKNVLDICRENQLSLVYLSSWEIYSGYKTKEFIADEYTAPRPGGTYGQTKFLCETLIEHYRKHYGLFCTILRSSPVYGLGSDKPKFIWNFLHKALNHQKIVTHRYLNGFPILDLLYVDDLCTAILAAIERQVEGSINLGSGTATSTTQIAEYIVDFLGAKSPIEHIEIAGYSSNIIMDISYANSVLNWYPKVNLIEGLKTIVDKVSSSST